MAQYAANTSVSVEKSRAEIESTLGRYGAKQFGYMSDMLSNPPRAIVTFRCSNRLVRFDMDLPSRDEFNKTPGGKRVRKPDQAYKAWEQSCRQRWRALGLAIKAKLEAVESGISQFEEEFLAFIVDPATNRTVGQQIRPQLEASYNSNKPKRLMLTIEGN